MLVGKLFVKERLLLKLGIMPTPLISPANRSALDLPV